MFVTSTSGFSSDAFQVPEAVLLQGLFRPASSPVRNHKSSLDYKSLVSLFPHKGFAGSGLNPVLLHDQMSALL